MTAEERLAQQRRVWTAIKAAWKLNPKLRLGQMLVTAVNEMGGPKDLVDVDDEMLQRALERMTIKVKAIKRRAKEK